MAENLDKIAQNMRSRVYKHMLNTRGPKYRVFLRYLGLFKYVSFSKTRGDLLQSYYTLMRYLDDVVDGDAPLPQGYSNATKYISEKISFSKNLKTPKDEVDFLMIHCFELAHKINEDFNSETEDILKSLLFDAKRRDKSIIFPKKVLMHHFHLMDIRGTIKATLKLFKEDPNKYNLLEPLGIATRYQFDLEDFEADIKAGYINITEEECQQFSINKDDLNLNNPCIKDWFRHRAELGLSLLEEHHRRLSQGNFSFLTRITFPIVYELPARKLFRKVLKDLKQ